MFPEVILEAILRIGGFRNASGSWLVACGLWRRFLSTSYKPRVKALVRPGCAGTQATGYKGFCIWRTTYDV